MKNTGCALMLKYILPIAFAFITGWFCYDYGYKTAYNKYNSQYIKQLKEQQASLQELQKKFVFTQLEKENEIKAINSKQDAIISSLRNRPERATQPASNDSPAICTGAGSTGEQLFREDAEFLIGEASKAEVLKQSLISCRRYLLGNNND